MHRKQEKTLYFDVQVESSSKEVMVIKIEGYGKLLKFLEGVLKIDLIARTLYHFEGNWTSSFYNRGPKVETWAGIHFM